MSSWTSQVFKWIDPFFECSAWSILLRKSASGLLFLTAKTKDQSKKPCYFTWKFHVTFFSTFRLNLPLFFILFSDGSLFAFAISAFYSWFSFFFFIQLYGFLQGFSWSFARKCFRESKRLLWLLLSTPHGNVFHLF